MVNINDIKGLESSVNFLSLPFLGSLSRILNEESTEPL